MKWILTASILFIGAQVYAEQLVSYEVVSSSAIKKTLVITGPDLENEKTNLNFQIDSYQKYIDENPTTRLQALVNQLKEFLAIVNQAN